MKHVQLFENFRKPILNLATIAQEMINSASLDPELFEYDLERTSLYMGPKNRGKKIIFIKWTNPQEVQRWRDSGYAEDFGPEDVVPPLNVLAILSHKGIFYAYTLTPEEKYYGRIYIDLEDEEADLSQMVELRSFEDFKFAFLTSLWDED